MYQIRRNTLEGSRNPWLVVGRDPERPHGWSVRIGVQTKAEGQQVKDNLKAGRDCFFGFDFYHEQDFATWEQELLEA